MKSSETPKRAKVPPWLRKHINEEFRGTLTEDARSAIATSLFETIAPADAKIIDSIDWLVQFYHAEEKRRKAHPPAEDQQKSLKDVRTALDLLGRLDIETNKRFYLSLGKSKKEDFPIGPIKRFERGKRRFSKLVLSIERAHAFAETRAMRPTKGPRTHETLKWLVHELAIIWEAQTNKPFQSSVNSMKGREHVRPQERPRRFIETVLRQGGITPPPEAITYVVKSAARWRHQVAESSEDSEASDATYGKT